MTVEEIPETRTGRFVGQPEGYVAFIPWGLPPDPPIALDPELWVCLSRADHSLGRLDGSIQTLPKPDLFDFMYIRQEAVLSCQIEGSQTSLRDLLEYEARATRQDAIGVRQVVSCLAAINHGLEQIQGSSISLGLVLSCHEKFFTTGFQGKEKYPGQFRPTQNYIGSPGSTLETARYIPPPPQKITALLDNLEEFCHAEYQMPSLVKAGLVHAQFESIHPFEDGNGPLGRFLITLLLIEMGTLKHPLLWLSSYFKHHRKEYYDRLQAVRDYGDWENWLKFFLRAVHSVARQATEIAHQIVLLRESHWHKIAVQMGSSAGSALTLLDELYQRPIVSIQQVAKITNTSSSGAQNIITKLQKLGLLREITGKHRGELFAYEPYLALFTEQAISSSRQESPPITENTERQTQLERE